MISSSIIDKQMPTRVQQLGLLIVLTALAVYVIVRVTQ
jgi:hypothetical protein